MSVKRKVTVPAGSSDMGQSCDVHLERSSCRRRGRWPLLPHGPRGCTALFLERAGHLRERAARRRKLRAGRTHRSAEQPFGDLRPNVRKGGLEIAASLTRSTTLPVFWPVSGAARAAPRFTTKKGMPNTVSAAGFAVRTDRSISPAARYVSEPGTCRSPGASPFKELKPNGHWVERL
jgi:hypothetical protein